MPPLPPSLPFAAPDPGFGESREAQLSHKSLKYLLVLQQYRKELRVSAEVSHPISPFPTKSGASIDLWGNIKKMLKKENQASSERFPIAGAGVQCQRAESCSVPVIKTLSNPSLSVQSLLIPFYPLFLLQVPAQ